MVVLAISGNVVLAMFAIYIIVAAMGLISFNTVQLQTAEIRKQNADSALKRDLTINATKSSTDEINKKADLNREVTINQTRALLDTQRRAGNTTVLYFENLIKNISNAENENKVLNQQMLGEIKKFQQNIPNSNSTALNLQLLDKAIKNQEEIKMLLNQKLNQSSTK